MVNKNVNMEKAGRTLRKLRGIRTRTGVAREAGIPYSTLQAYEDGTRIPSGRNMEILADYYGVRVEDIFFSMNTTQSSDKKEEVV